MVVCHTANIPHACRMLTKCSTEALPVAFVNYISLLDACHL